MPEAAVLPEHSPYGGSVAALIRACAAVPRECAKIPEQPATADMAAGTAAHKLIHQCLLNGFDPDDLIGRMVHGTKIMCTPEMARSVQAFVDRARADEKAGGVNYIEHKFVLPQFEEMLWGTVDRACYFPALRHLKIEEFKFGAGVYVPVEENDQCLTYGCGAYFTLNLPVDSIEIVVDQPRSWEGTETLRRWHTDPLRLVEFITDYKAAIERSKAPDAPHTVGDHCQMCKARGACPALYTAALKAAGADFEPHSRSFMAPTAPELLSRDELGDRKTQSDILRIWLNGVDQLAFNEGLSGRPPTGWKIVETDGHRAFLDADLAMHQAMRVFPDHKLGEDDLWARKALSPAQFEKLVGKAAAKDFVAVHLAPAKKVKTLVPIADSRPAFDGIAADFGHLGDLPE